MPSKTAFGALAVALTTVATVLAAASPAGADTPFTFAVIGDVPYGSAQLAALPNDIAQINADSAVQFTAHVGDISSPLNCSDAYYATVKADFDRFQQPFVYTPGDNEWADCHRAPTGAGNPLDRLAAVRSTFFPTPGMTMGQHPMTVHAQADYPENVWFDEGGVTVAAMNIPGSDNDLDAWTGLGYSSATADQTAEEQARSSADIQLMSDAFAHAASAGSRAVVLLTQADMFASSSPSSTYKKAFTPIVQAMASDAAGFAAPVVLVNGDTHVYTDDVPLTSSTWLSTYGIAKPVPNFRRITVQSGTSEYARFTVVPDASVLQVQRVPVTTQPSNTPPTARFAASTDALTASFDGSASTDPGGSVASYAWTFGDGVDGSGPTATHTYAAAGTYTVTLTVTDAAGATGSSTQSVTVTDAGSAPAPSTLIASGSAWSYLYPTSTPPSTWAANGFDDSAWKSGPAPLGWGDTSVRTTLTTTASVRPLTAYYRRTVTVADPSVLGSVTLTTRADDGVVVYVDGKEVGRSNMPAGTVTNGTYATSAVSAKTAIATPVTITVPGSAFVTGTNTIAVEMHSNYHAAASNTFELTAVAANTGTATGSGGGGDTGGSTGGTGGSTGGTGGTGGSTGGTTSGTPLPSGTTVLAPGSTWSYLHPASAPAATWMTSGFDTSAWASGAAPIGWGSSGLATTMSLPSGTNPLASYYVSGFTIPAGGVPASGLTLTTRADDGVIVYVNGTEVGRSNLPAGTVGWGTYAVTARSTATAVANPVSFTVPASLLQEGRNVIAAEVQSNYHAAKDSSFDLGAVVK